MLKDSAFIQEKDAENQTKKNARKGLPAVRPLYTSRDAEAALKLVKPILYDQLIELNEDIKIVPYVIQEANNNVNMVKFSDIFEPPIKGTLASESIDDEDCKGNIDFITAAPEWRKCDVEYSSSILENRERLESGGTGAADWG